MSNGNSYDLLRLILSVFVIISHCTYITGIHSPLDIDYISNGQTYLGEIGVMGFFSLSGFLITKSINRSKNILTFIFHRVVRVFPGFWVCIFATAFIIAPIIFYIEHHTLKSFNFLGGYSSYTYVRLNFSTFIRQAEISHVLDKSKIHNLNGSLWSLFYELLCYLITIFLFVFRLIKHKRVFLIAFASLYAFYVYSFLTQTNPEYYKLFICYLSGTSFYLFNSYLSLSKKHIAILSAIFIALLFFGYVHVLMPLLITLICLNLFAQFTIKLPYDISYGLYIYGFPVQQFLNSINHNFNPILFFIVSLLITSVLSFLSFTIIEKPALKLKKINYSLLLSS